MSVLVDSSVWSLAIRRRPARLSGGEYAFVVEWRRLVNRGEVSLIGPIRQEVLSGIRHQAQFEKLRVFLDGFTDIELIHKDFIQAARFFNQCQDKGIAGTSIDLLICAVSYRLNVPIFSADRDFFFFSQILPIHLHHPPRA